MRRLASWFALTTVIATSLAAFAFSLPGDGDHPSRDCLVGFEVDAVTLTVTDRRQGATLLSCTDCDPGCDRDGTRDGGCVIRLRGCLNSETRACKPRPITRVRFRIGLGTQRVPYDVTPPADATPVCGPWVDARVVPRRIGKRPGRSRLWARAHAELNDVVTIADGDRFIVLCNDRPDSEPCPDSAFGAFATTPPAD